MHETMVGTINTHWGTIRDDKTMMGTNESMLRNGGMTLGNNKICQAKLGEREEGEVERW